LYLDIQIQGVEAAAVFLAAGLDETFRLRQGEPRLQESPEFPWMLAGEIFRFRHGSDPLNGHAEARKAVLDALAYASRFVLAVVAYSFLQPQRMAIIAHVLSHVSTAYDDHELIEVCLALSTGHGFSLFTVYFATHVNHCACQRVELWSHVSEPPFLISLTTTAQIHACTS
jgi:hypothetical protein